MMLNEQEQRRLLRTLQDDPAFLAQVRSLILPAELVQLPERFAQFASQVTAFIERQEEFNSQITAFIARQEEFNAWVTVRFQKMDDRFQIMDDNLQRMDDHFQIMDVRFRRVTDDLGVLKGHVAGRVAREMADDITESLGFEIIELLNGKDLRVMLRGHKPHDISPGTRRSFYLADMVALVEDQDGNRLYIAAEASYTADARDSQRAVRNAQFLTRFTGIDAVPAVVSLSNDRDVQQLVDAGSILWFQFEARDLQPQ